MAEDIRPFESATHNPGIHELADGSEVYEGVSRRGFLTALGVGALAVYFNRDKISNTLEDWQSDAPELNGEVFESLPDFDVPTETLPAESFARFKEHYPAIERMRPVYKAVEKETGVPWKFMAAIHYREGSNNPKSSMYAGEELGTRNPDFGNVMETDIFRNGVGAAKHFIENAKVVYGIDVRPDMNQLELAFAFLAFNRGSMYRNAIKHIGREMSPAESPYVMNGVDEAHMNMRWPDVGHYAGSASDWGEPQSVQGKRNTPLGALTIVRGIDQLQSGGEVLSKRKIILIGDSLSVGDIEFAKAQEADAFFNKEIIHMDALGGRSTIGSRNAIDALKAAGDKLTKADVLVFAIGTNMPESNQVYEQKLREAIFIARTRKHIDIVIPELMGYKPGSENADKLQQRNEILQKLAKEGLIRYLPLNIQPDEIEQDHVHLTKKGYQARTVQILQAA